MPSDSVHPDDGYDHNRLDTDPARRATNLKDLPFPVSAPEVPQEISTTATYEDLELTQMETLPHIYQRQQGGWNAKVPDLETTKSNGLIPHQVPNKPSGKLKRLMLRWTIDRKPDKRTLLVNDAEEDGQLEDPDLQRRVFWK